MYCRSITMAGCWLVVGSLVVFSAFSLLVQVMLPSMASLVSSMMTMIWTMRTPSPARRLVEAVEHIDCWGLIRICDEDLVTRVFWMVNDHIDLFNYQDPSGFSAARYRTTRKQYSAINEILPPARFYTTSPIASLCYI